MIAHRTTKTESLSDYTGAIKSSKCIAYATFEIITPEDHKIIRLHHTDIVTILPTGNVILNSGGWRSPTTKARMNHFIPHEIYVSQHLREWYVAQGGAWVPNGKKKRAIWLEDPTHHIFYDGMQLTSHCRLVGEPESPRDVEAREQKKKLIRKYVNLIDNMEKLPMPSQGDCWGCCMVDKEGNPGMGDSHLETHISDKSINGSQLVLAMRHYGLRDEQIGFFLQVESMKDRVKDILYKYMTDKLVYNTKSTAGKATGYGSN